MKFEAFDWTDWDEKQLKTLYQCSMLSRKRKLLWGFFNITTSVLKIMAPIKLGLKHIIERIGLRNSWKCFFSAVCSRANISTCFFPNISTSVFKNVALMKFNLNYDSTKMMINCSFLSRNGRFSQGLSAAKNVQKAFFRPQTCLVVFSAADGALKTENSTFDSRSNQFSK